MSGSDRDCAVQIRYCAVRRRAEGVSCAAFALGRKAVLYGTGCSSGSGFIPHYGRLIGTWETVSRRLRDSTN